MSFPYFVGFLPHLKYTHRLLQPLGCDTPILPSRCRRRRRYHRHYHRRLRFLHRRRPPCRRLPESSSSRGSLRQVYKSSTAVLVSLISWLPSVFVSSVLCGITVHCWVLSHSLTIFFWCLSAPVGLVYWNYSILTWCTSKSFRFFRLGLEFLLRPAPNIYEPGSSTASSAPSSNYDAPSASMLLDIFVESRFSEFMEDCRTSWASVDPLDCPSDMLLSSSIVTSFCDSFDPLALHRLVHFSASPPSSVSEGGNSSGLQLSDITSTPLVQTLLSAPSSCYYQSHVRSLAGAYIATPDRSSVPIVLDTGASRGLSPFREDFTTYEKLDPPQPLHGVGTGALIEGKGLVTWHVRDQFDVEGTLQSFAYHVPSCNVRLYSPQTHFGLRRLGELWMNSSEARLSVPLRPDSADLTMLSFPFHPESNLPLMLLSDHPNFVKSLFASPTSVLSSPHAFAGSEHLAHGGPKVESFETLAPVGGFTSFFEENYNVTPAQLELLFWHWRLGHVGMDRIQRMMHPSRKLDNAPLSSNDSSLSHPVVIPTRQATTHKCEVPRCQACLYAKMTRRSSHSTVCSPIPEKQFALSKEHCSPGDCVSVDQFMVTEKGRLLHTFGKEKSKLQYSGGTIYRDHASNFLYTHLQVSLRAEDTIVGKHLFERTAALDGVTIKKYHGDNGIFNAQEFVAELRAKEQEVSYSGVGAQHQNGKAERSIRTVFNLARAMLIHSALHWPEAHDLSLWPFAVEYAIWILNNLPESDGLSPIEKFSGQKFANYDHVRRARVFGAPCYVLDPTLQDGKKLPKFNPRSRQGKFLGFSKCHSSSVGLILNRTTGKISPQFHVVYDDCFQTVRSVHDVRDIDLDNFDWDAFITPARTERYIDDEDDAPPLHDSWQQPFGDLLDQPRSALDTLDGLSVPPRRQRSASSSSRPLSTSEGVPISSVSEGDTRLPLPSALRPPRSSRSPQTSRSVTIDLTSDPDDESENQPPPSSVSEGEGRLSPPSSASEGDAVSLDTSDGVVQPSSSLTPAHEARSQAISAAQANADDRRRSQRKKTPNSTIFNDSFDTSFLGLDDASAYALQQITHADLTTDNLANLSWPSSLQELDSLSGDATRFFGSNDLLRDPVTNELDDLHPFALHSRLSASARDNPRWREAMNGPHRDGFTKASIIEMSTLQHMDAWEQVPRQSWMNVIPSTWAFKIKRFPDGLVRKFKARFCVRGDKQIEGIDVFDTFAPVVQWSTVRLLLVLSLSLGLATKQVDYVAAFCQAPITEDIYVALPQGWRSLNRSGKLKERFKENHVLKLKRSLYGLRQSPKNFFDYLRENLDKCGFEQSKHDPCLFYSPTVICVSYVDDCLFFSRSDADINAAIEKIRSTGMDLQVEDSVAGFLGVHIDRFKVTNDDGTEETKIKLTQIGLIDRILEALGLDSSVSDGVSTPAVATPLVKDADGVPFDNSFNYASVVGMCMYLCNNSRPDIAFAVNQCSRFSHAPTELHANALRRIGRYLLRTRKDGLIMTCSRSMEIDCYVDADFAGLYNHEDPQDPVSVRSRTGFVIMVGKCPIIWKSFLQSEQTMSTMESEYVACSSACRELYPIIDLVREIGSSMGITTEESSDIHSTIWEDNVGALTLARLELPRMTPRSKHISIKYHWFRSRTAKGASPSVKVKKIESINQIADIFTKGLGPLLFESLREMLMGW